MIALLLATSIFALNDGWTADGDPVVLPHCWNIEDGTDGPTDYKCSGHESVDGTGYVRKKVAYSRNLPPQTPGKKRYLRVHAASIHAVVRVDGTEVGRHAGAFTAFTFELPPNGNRLEMWKLFGDAVRDLEEASMSDDPERFRELMEAGRKYFEQ